MSWRRNVFIKAILKALIWILCKLSAKVKARKKGFTFADASPLWLFSKSKFLGQNSSKLACKCHFFVGMIYCSYNIVKTGWFSIIFLWRNLYNIVFKANKPFVIWLLYFEEGRIFDVIPSKAVVCAQSSHYFSRSASRRRCLLTAVDTCLSFRLWNQSN